MAYDLTLQEAFKENIHYIRSGFCGTVQEWISDSMRDYKELLRPASPLNSELLRASKEVCIIQDELLRSSKGE